MAGCILRGFREQDYRELGYIMDGDWEFHSYGDDWHSITDGFIDLCAGRSDLVRVAELDGRTVGILCVQSDPSAVPGVPPDHPGTGSSVYLRDLETLHDADSSLKVRNDLSGLGELVLLTISRDTRGSGIGAMLMDTAEGFLRSKGRRGMFISTDDDCNFGFYEHLGAVRIGECMCDILGERLTRMLYRLDFR